MISAKQAVEFLPEQRKIIQVLVGSFFNGYELICWFNGVFEFFCTSVRDHAVIGAVKNAYRAMHVF